MELNRGNKRSFGTSGEKVAKDYLINSGYQILFQNYRVGRMGEIDIIAGKNEYICFIEVKTRTGNAFGTPAEAVTYRKQQNIKRLAQIYMKQYKLYNCNMRFDIVEVMVNKSDREFVVKNINLIENAF